MRTTTTAPSMHIEQRRAERMKTHLWVGAAIAIMALTMFEPAFAQTTTGSGGATAAQARVNAVALGWQNIVQGVGVAVLVIAWSYIGYMIAFAGKTMKDMFPTMVGTSIAGLAPVLVGWLFS